MNKNFSIFFLIIFTSCNVNLEPPKSNNDYKNIIGKSKVIGNLKIAQYDFPESIDWHDANEACALLGVGWRLPTIEELNILYKNKKRIGAFTFFNLYWSSTSADYYPNALGQYFDDGRRVDDGKNRTHYVRCVSSF